MTKSKQLAKEFIMLEFAKKINCICLNIEYNPKHYLQCFQVFLKENQCILCVMYRAKSATSLVNVYLNRNKM